MLLNQRKMRFPYPIELSTPFYRRSRALKEIRRQDWSMHRTRMHSVGAGTLGEAFAIGDEARRG